MFHHHVYRRPPDRVLPRKIPFSALFIAPQVYTVSISDGIQFFDPSTKDEGHLQSDQLYLLDTLLRGQNTFASDGVQFTDSQLLQTIFGRLFSDGIMFNDTILRDITKVVVDSVLLNDVAYRQVLKYSFDSLLLSQGNESILDTALILVDGLYMSDQEDHYPVRTRYAADGIFLTDSLYKIFNKVVGDGVVLDDTTRKLLERVLIDKLLLVDSVSTSLNEAGQLVTRSTTDGLLFDDHQRLSLEKILFDGFFLGDSGDAQRSATVYALDQLVMGEERFSLLLKFLHEAILQNDEVRNLVIRTVLLSDSLMLEDVRRSMFELHSMDTLLPNDYSTKLRTLLLVDQMSIGDAVSTLLTQAVSAVISFMLVQALNPLGMALTYVHPLSMSVAYETQRIG